MGRRLSFSPDVLIPLKCPGDYNNKVNQGKLADHLT